MNPQAASDTRVAVLGMGIMGSAMALNLVRAGLRTTVWDRTPAAVAALADAGAQTAASPEQAVREANVVITMLPTADVVASVVFGGGVAQAFARSAVWAQMGTIGVEATKQIAARLAEVRPDVLYVDAPVSGSKGPAISGQLLVLASGPREAQPLVMPAFSAIAHKTVWLGDAGQGSRMKLVVNAYLSILVEGVAEALELADRLGIEHAKLAEVIEGGPLRRTHRQREASQDGRRRLHRRVPPGVGVEGRGSGARVGKREPAAAGRRAVPAVARGGRRRPRACGHKRRAPGARESPDRREMKS